MLGRVSVSAGRMIGLGLALFGLMIVAVYAVGINALQFFTGYSYFTDFPPYRFPMALTWFIDVGDTLAVYVVAAVAAYLYVARRLVRVTWGRALAESCGLMATLAVVYVGAITVAYPKAFAGASLPAWLTPLIAILRLAIELAIVAVIAALLARGSASWDQVRAQTGSRVGGDIAFPVVLLLIAAAIMNWSDVLGGWLLRYGDYEQYIVFIHAAAALDFLATLVLVIVSSALTTSWLNRLLAQAAAPSWSPSPAPPVAMPFATPPAPTPPPATPPITLDPNQ
jgi:hypothetical protein